MKHEQRVNELEQLEAYLTQVCWFRETDTRLIALRETIDVLRRMETARVVEKVAGKPMQGKGY